MKRHEAMKVIVTAMGGTIAAENTHADFSNITARFASPDGADRFRETLVPLIGDDSMGRVVALGLLNVDTTEPAAWR